MIAFTKEGKISFWSLIAYNQLFHYDIKQEIIYFQLTADEKYLAYTINKKEEKDEKMKNNTDNLFIKKNSFATDTGVAAGPGSEFSYMKYVMDLINNKGK
ncbi:unnamed protein product [Blepharisma stoltei]|uniref:Uncharacterized protein n=1 Tax=Blepharisma stoltei TaxID=1481888 RepID=A0AAU9JT14_9CILI|nr:unnamed protein product [Blepharisma stoltei]